MQRVIEVTHPSGATTLYGPFRFERTARKAATKAGLDPVNYQIRDLKRGRNIDPATPGRK